MKWESSTDPRTGDEHFNVVIDQHDYLNLPRLDGFDSALREECVRSNSIADKFLWLERFARLLEQQKEEKA